MECDVIVVGGAMVGSTLALALVQQGLNVTLLDSRTLLTPARDQGGSSDPKDTEKIDALDKRTTAVAAATATLLDALGIWPEIETDATPIRTIQVSQRGSFGALRMSAEELDVQALGYVVDNGSYTRCMRDLMRRAISQDGGPADSGANSRAHGEGIGLRVLSPVQVHAVSQTEHSVSLCISSQDEHTTVTGTDSTSNLTARLLVAVDGSHSTLRSQLGIGVMEADYDQYAIVASVVTELPNQGCAYERFTASGPLAMLPVATHISSAICTVEKEQAERFLQSDRASWPERTREMLQQQFGYRLGQLERCSQPAIYPLVLRTASQASCGRALLMGNALRTLHPVAGQGFNLAVRDIGKLAELLGQIEARQDAGSSALLARFSAARSQDQAITVGATDGLARLFRGKSRPLSHFRALGLSGLDSIPAFKRAFARRAMGYGVALPDLKYHR